MPGIQMAAKHNHFIFFVGSLKLSDNIVRGCPFRETAVLNIELKFNVEPVTKQARDSAVIFVAQDYRRYDLFDVERPVVEGSNLPVFTSGVVYSNRGAVVKKKIVQLFIHLRRSKLDWFPSRCRGWSRRR